MKKLILISVLVLTVFSGCAMLDYMLQPNVNAETGESTPIQDFGKTMLDVATASGLLPPWMGPIILSFITGGGGLLAHKANKHKKERIKLATIVESLKEVAPEEVDILLSQLEVTDKNFYDKYIKGIRLCVDEESEID